MDTQTHNISLLAPCGLYCYVCPRFDIKCKGCMSNQGVAKNHRRLCGIFKCTDTQDIQRCNQCQFFDACDHLQKFISWDSYVSHAPAVENLKSLNAMGEESFIKSIKERIKDKEYPPAVRKGTLSFRNFFQWMKVPVKRKKD